MYMDDGTTQYFTYYNHEDRKASTTESPIRQKGSRGRFDVKSATCWY